MLTCVCGCIWAACTCKCVSRQQKGGHCWHSQSPLRALNCCCYLVSQVLRLCCSNATGAKALTCTRWLCGWGTVDRLDWIPGQFLCVTRVCPVALEMCGRCRLLSMHCQIPCILWIFRVVFSWLQISFCFSPVTGCFHTQSVAISTKSTVL